MSKIYATFLLVFAFGPAAFAQEGPARISHNYFRSDPFTGEFSSFLQHLLNDPDIGSKELRKRTDTSLFIFSGSFRTYNPFFFKPKRVEVILSEAQVKFKDSTAFDTVYIYELVAYNDATEAGMKEVTKEFERIFRKYRNSFPKSTYSENNTGSEGRYQAYHFFYPNYLLAPFSLSWYGPDDHNEGYVALTLRFDNNYNRATLPIPLNTP